MIFFFMFFRFELNYIFSIINMNFDEFLVFTKTNNIENFRINYLELNEKEKKGLLETKDQHSNLTLLENSAQNDSDNVFNYLCDEYWNFYDEDYCLKALGGGFLIAVRKVKFNIMNAIVDRDPICIKKLKNERLIE